MVVAVVVQEQLMQEQEALAEEPLEVFHVEVQLVQVTLHQLVPLKVILEDKVVDQHPQVVAEVLQPQVEQVHHLDQQVPEVMVLQII